MREDELQRFRAEVVAQRNLPTIPPVLASILAILSSDTAGARQLVEVIEKDQSLTAKLLKLANAAFFGQPRRVATIPRAILLLGFATVRNLALGVKVWDALGGRVEKQRLAALWDHAVVSAACARALGGGLRACDPDEAFTAGLLRDIGRLVMAGKFGALYWETTDAATPDDPEWAREQATFGVHHADVGAWVLESWNLPALIVEAVRVHHAGTARGGLPRVLAVTTALLAQTDVATATVDDAAAAIFAETQAEGLTAATWCGLVERLRESGAFHGLGDAWR
jgi:HD-like signal output (HDOD) protein